MGVGRDGGEVRRGVGEGAERVHPPDVVGDARVRRGQQGERPADAEAHDPDALGIDLGPRGEELECAHDPVDLARLQAALQQDARVGHEHRDAGPGQRVGHAFHDRMVAPDIVDAEDEEHRAGAFVGRGPRRQPQLGELRVRAIGTRPVFDRGSLGRLAEEADSGFGPASSRLGRRMAVWMPVRVGSQATATTTSTSRPMPMRRSQGIGASYATHPEAGRDSRCVGLAPPSGVGGSDRKLDLEPAAIEDVPLLAVEARTDRSAPGSRRDGVRMHPCLRPLLGAQPAAAPRAVARRRSM